MHVMRHALCQIGPLTTELTTELTAIDLQRNRCFLFFLVAINPILFKLAGYKDMNKFMDEFEFRTNWTTDFGGSFPLAFL